MESRRLTSEESTDFIGFMDLIKTLMEAMWEDEAPVFTMSRPHPTNSNNVSMPQIIYSPTKRQPATVGNSNTREIKPRLREQRVEYSSVYEKDVPVWYTGQLIEVETTFTIYASSNDQVFFWTDMFKNFIQEYKGYFLNKGVQAIWWQEDLETEHGLGVGEHYVARDIKYLIRLEELQRTEHPPIETIDLVVSAAKNKLELNGELPSSEFGRFKVTKKAQKTHKEEI